jgi:hypothetical protein
MSAIVEQVENAAQVQIAASFGADAAQGFFFSHPISKEDARTFAAGPDIPVFSRVDAQTLLLADGASVPVESLLTDVEPERDASTAPPVPAAVPTAPSAPHTVVLPTP